MSLLSGDTYGIVTVGKTECGGRLSEVTVGGEPMILVAMEDETGKEIDRKFVSPRVIDRIWLTSREHVAMKILRRGPAPILSQVWTKRGGF